MGWIPDFQHYTHSEFFSELDFVSRSVYFNAIAEKYPLVLLSSECAKHDFVEFLPQHSDKARVARFTSSLWTANLDERPQDALSKYHLPEKYTLVANQFWLHKNHKILPAALSLARSAAPRGNRSSIEIPLRLVRASLEMGAPEDARKRVAELEPVLSGDWRLRWYSGQCALLEGEFDKAAADFNAVLATLPGELAPKLAIAATAELRGDQHLSLMLASEPGDAPARSENPGHRRSFRLELCPSPRAGTRPTRGSSAGSRRRASPRLGPAG
jgi:hypothetical protein